MNDTQLRSHTTGLHVVKYDPDQGYEPRHDFSGVGDSWSHFSSLIIYLKSAAEGGATSFPRAFDNRGLQVNPEVGSALLMYNSMPDGNLDDLSVHGGLPVTEGKKWIGHLRFNGVGSAFLK